MLWKDVSVGKEPKASFQAILFSALLAAAVSISEDTIIADYGVGKAEFVDNFRQGAEAALSRANFLRTTKLETIQALVMYLVRFLIYTISTFVQLTSSDPSLSK